MRFKNLVLVPLLSFALGATLQGDGFAATAGGATKLLDEMGALPLPAPERDALLGHDLDLVSRSGRQGMTGPEVVAFIDFAFQGAEARQRFSFEMHGEEIARFIELEGRLAAEKDVPVETWVAALRKYEKNPLFVLVVARMAVMRHGSALAATLRDSLNALDPGVFEVEWFLLARELSHLENGAEFLPFYRKGIKYREIKFGGEAKVELSSDQMLWVLFTALGPEGERLAVESLASKNPLERRSTAMLVGSLLAAEAEEKLAAQLVDAGDPAGQMLAARSLALLFATSRAEALERVARSPVAEVRVAALGALGELALKRSLPTLLGALGDRSALVRRAAASSLPRYVDVPEVIARLEKFVGSEPVSSARSSAVATLAQSPLEKATAALTRLRKKEALPALVASLESALQNQIVQVARGGLPPQFAFYDADRRLIGPQPPAEARAALTKMVDQDRKFSATMIAGLATGLERQDLPKLKEARRLIAINAPPNVLVQELGTLNAVIRSVIARVGP